MQDVLGKGAGLVLPTTRVQDSKVRTLLAARAGLESIEEELFGFSGQERQSRGRLPTETHIAKNVNIFLSQNDSG